MRSGLRERLRCSPQVLYTSNENGNSVTTYRHSPTGELTALGRYTMMLTTPLAFITVMRYY